MYRAELRGAVQARAQARGASRILPGEPERRVHEPWLQGSRESLKVGEEGKMKGEQEKVGGEGGREGGREGYRLDIEEEHIFLVLLIQIPKSGRLHQREKVTIDTRQNSVGAHTR